MPLIDTGGAIPHYAPGEVTDTIIVPTVTLPNGIVMPGATIVITRKDN